MTDRRRNKPSVSAKPHEALPEFVPFLTGPDLPEELIERLCKALCPPLLATVDMPSFVRLIGISNSLSALQKLRIFDALHTLSQFQIDELIKVMNDEASEFAELVPNEWRIIASLSAKSWLHLCLVADHLGAGYPDDATERQALTRMLKRKYCGEGREGWVSSALGQSPPGDHVFSAFTIPALRSPGLSRLPEVF
jgi:hypothetical protein